MSASHLSVLVLHSGSGLNPQGDYSEVAQLAPALLLPPSPPQALVPVLVSASPGPWMGTWAAPTKWELSAGETLGVHQTIPRAGTQEGQLLGVNCGCPPEDWKHTHTHIHKPPPLLGEREFSETYRTNLK